MYFLFLRADAGPFSYTSCIFVFHKKRKYSLEILYLDGLEVRIKIEMESFKDMSDPKKGRVLLVCAGISLGTGESLKKKKSVKGE